MNLNSNNVTCEDIIKQGLREANKNIDISLICIANKKDIYAGFLTNLRSQINVSYELITIFNYNNEFDSARCAFNQNAKSAKGKYIAFVHPDVRFTSPTALHDITVKINNISDFGVVGVAGALPIGNRKRQIISSIYQGPHKTRVGVWANCDYEEVQTVDECFFIVQNKYFQRHVFEETRGWHLYAVEYCLNALIDGERNYVVKADLWHLSPGYSLDPNYVKQLEILIKKYKQYFQLICTTVKAWPTRGARAYLYRRYYYCKQTFKQIIKRK
ncbi:glycosyltransferase [Bifidobacterium apri]|uniref:glycosyltransferase n=1 Tax=Bifidobacterium apri TaxID=1769423 RepID=UPI0039940FFA